MHRPVDDKNEFIETMVRFCRDRITRLDQLFHWEEPDDPPPAPAVLRVDLGWSSAEWNLQLKTAMRTAWANANLEQRKELAAWVVIVWGGVKRNKPETLDEYVIQWSRKPSEFPTPFDGIASYSKILSMSDGECAIYDARVAAALNAVQLKARNTSGYRFSIPQGRNSAIKRFAVALSNGRLNTDGWHRVPRGGTYKFYLETMHAVRDRIPNSTVDRLEMVLFGLASRLARELCTPPGSERFPFSHTAPIPLAASPRRPKRSTGSDAWRRGLSSRPNRRL